MYLNIHSYTFLQLHPLRLPCFCESPVLKTVESPVRRLYPSMTKMPSVYSRQRLSEIGPQIQIFERTQSKL